MRLLQSRERAQANEAVEVFSKLEGEIRQLVSRDTTALRLRKGNDSESAATNIGSMLQHVSGTSVQEIEKLIGENAAEGGGARANCGRGVRSTHTKRQAINGDHFGEP
jgi:hypothetical protein